jgi:hypothetical protein
MSEERPEAIDNAITRRQWILRLGEAVALVGFSGVAPEVAAGLLRDGLLHDDLLRDESSHPGLPPGLYLPSADSLVHSLAGGHKQFTPPPGSETDYVQPNSGPFQPQFFSADEFAVVTGLVSVILGQVDPLALSQATQWVDLWFHSAAEVRQAARELDPLHRVLAAHYYGESAVHELETADPEAIAREGIAALQKLTDEKYRRGFDKLDLADQVDVVRSIQASPAERALRRFFQMTRGEAIRGYFTSAQGLAELNYTGNAYYGDCPGCGLIHPEKPAGSR